MVAGNFGVRRSRLLTQNDRYPFSVSRPKKHYLIVVNGNRNHSTVVSSARGHKKKTHETGMYSGLTLPSLQHSRFVLSHVPSPRTACRGCEPKGDTQMQASGTSPDVLGTYIGDRCTDGVVSRLPVAAEEKQRCRTVDKVQRIQGGCMYAH